MRKRENETGKAATPFLFAVASSAGGQPNPPVEPRSAIGWQLRARLFFRAGRKNEISGSKTPGFTLYPPEGRKRRQPGRD